MADSRAAGGKERESCVLCLCRRVLDHPALNQEVVIRLHRDDPKALEGIECQEVPVVGHEIVSTASDGSLKNRNVLDIIRNRSCRGRFNQGAPPQDASLGELGQPTRKAEVIAQDVANLVYKVAGGVHRPACASRGLNHLLGSGTEKRFGNVDVCVEEDLHGP